MTLRDQIRGAKAIAEFLGDSMRPVERERAILRSKICEHCPMNDGRKGWLAWAADRAARSYYRIKHGMKLSVPNEAKLGECRACHCPLALKVHVPIAHIADNTSEETLAKLPPICWILNEL